MENHRFVLTSPSISAHAHTRRPAVRGGTHSAHVSRVERPKSRSSHRMTSLIGRFRVGAIPGPAKDLRCRQPSATNCRSARRKQALLDQFRSMLARNLVRLAGISLVVAPRASANECSLASTIPAVTSSTNLRTAPPRRILDSIEG